MKLRTVTLAGLGLLFYAPLRLNLTSERATPFPHEARERLRRRFQASTESLAEALGRDLSAWLPAPSARDRAATAGT